MRGFDPIDLAWGDAVYSVPAERQMELILRVEHAILRYHPEAQAAAVLFRPTGLPLAQLANVYHVALAYAGASLSPLEVYRHLTDAAQAGDRQPIETAMTAIARILNLIGPDELDAADLPDAPAAEADVKKP